LFRKRRWKDFPSRLKREVDGTAGLAALGGTGIGLAGITILTPPFTPFFLGAGVIIAGGTLAYSIFKAIPPKLINAEDVLNREISIVELGAVVPTMASISIIGPSQAGKTTLRNRLTFIRNLTNRTNQISVKVVSVPAALQRFVAILDGGGQIYQQQFSLTELCDHLIVRGIAFGI
jgi:hypothetical protein